jgi:hypothetical protein
MRMLVPPQLLAKVCTMARPARSPSAIASGSDCRAPVRMSHVDHVTDGGRRLADDVEVLLGGSCDLFSVVLRHISDRNGLY